MGGAGIRVLGGGGVGIVGGVVRREGWRLVGVVVGGLGAWEAAGTGWRKEGWKGELGGAGTVGSILRTCSAAGWGLVGGVWASECVGK